MSTFKIASTDYIDNDKALFKKKSENQHYISFDNNLKINGDLYIGGLRPATTSFKLKFPQNGEKVGFYFGLNGTNQGHVLNMDLENTDESIKAFCNKINGLGNRFNPDDYYIPGNGTLEASFNRSSETDVFLSLSLYTSKALQYGNGMRLFGGSHWQTQEPQFAPWDHDTLPQGPELSGGGTPTNYSLTVNGSPLKEFKSIEENTSGVHIVNNFDISNSNKQTLLTVNDTGVVVGKSGAISTIVDVSSYQDMCTMRITSGSKRLYYQAMGLSEGIDHVVDVINDKAATLPFETYSNNFKVIAKKLSSTEFSLMLLDDGLTVDNCSGAIGPHFDPVTPLTFIKEASNFNMHVNGQLYDKNGNEILGGGGSGGSWYEHAEGHSEVYIGPGYGDTPSVNILSLGVKKQDKPSAGIDIGSDVNINTYDSGSQIWISADAPEADIHLFANDTIYIGPEMGGVKVYSDGKTYFNNNVYDKNGDEILGGGGSPLYNYDGSRVWIGPNEVYNDFGGFSVEVGSYHYGKNEYINAGYGDNLYLHAVSEIYIGPNTDNVKVSNVSIDAQSQIKLTVDDLSLELDKTKLQKLIDLLNQ